MILETKTKDTNSNVLIDDFSICSIKENNQNGTEIWIYGNSTPIVVVNPFNEMKKIFIEAKNRDRYTGEQKSKMIKKSFPVVKVDDFLFSITIVTNEWNNEVTKNLEVDANFKLKNEILKKEVEYIVGVETFNEFSFSKYKCSINIGKLFDAETIRDQVEQKFIEYLSI